MIEVYNREFDEDTGELIRGCTIVASAASEALLDEVAARIVARLRGGQSGTVITKDGPFVTVEVNAPSTEFIGMLHKVWEMRGIQQSEWPARLAAYIKREHGR